MMGAAVRREALLDNKKTGSTASGLKNPDTYTLKAIIQAPCGQIWTRLGQSEAPCFPYLLLGVLGGFGGQFRGVIRTNKDPENAQIRGQNPL